MTKWNMSDEAINMLQTMSQEIRNSADDLLGAHRALKTEFNRNKDGLGAHTKEIADQLDKLAKDEKTGRKYLLRLSGRLHRLAECRKYWRANGLNAAPNSYHSTEKGNSDAEEFLVQRTLMELKTFRDQLNLTDGDPSILQFGGIYSDVRAKIGSNDYEAHHIPAQTLFSTPDDQLPTIAMTVKDHKRTSTHTGHMRGHAHPSMPDSPQYGVTYKERLRVNLSCGYFAEDIRNEIWEIRNALGTKYDGAIKQYLDCMEKYLKENGLPELK